MNDNLQPLPNELLEARITAWVLGQASPFEAAELEDLCAADPELQLFLNRTKALHSLLLETPPSASDQFWKLSPEKREKLDPIIGSNHSNAPIKDSSIRRAAYRAAFGIAAVLTVTVFIKRFIFISAPLSHEESTMVSYSMESGESFSPNAIEDRPLEEMRFERKPDSAASPSRRKTAASALDEDKDTSIAFFDTEFKSDAKARDFDGDRQSGNKAPRSRIQAQEEHAEKSSKSNNIAAKGMSSASPTTPGVPPAPSAAPAELTLNDGGIGYAGGGGGQSDLSNTFQGLEAMTLTDKAIASNTPSPATIPIPNVEVTEPSMDFGEGKDFGDGWGGAKDQDGDAFAANESKNKGGFRYEPGAPKKESARSYGSSSYNAKLAEANERTNAEGSITAGNSISLNGVFDSSKNDITEGKRSGNQATERKSIDETLSNPDRSLAAGESAAPGTRAKEDSIRKNPALAPEHIEAVDKVRRDLQKGQGNFELGKFDDAKKSYEDILRVDPQNQAARRGLETVDNAKNDYYRAAYNNTRTELLTEVDKEWELAVPAEGKMNNDPLSATSQGGLANVREGGIKNDLSALLGADAAAHQKNNTAPEDAVGYLKFFKDESLPEITTRSGSESRDLAIDREFIYPNEYETPVPGNVNPAASDPFVELTKEGKDQLAQTDFDGFVNYGSPIVNQPKQIDITTKFVEITQENDQELGFNWLFADANQKAELDLYAPADPANSIDFKSHITGFTGDLDVPAWTDIPITGRLFQEGDKAEILNEIHAGYKSEYLYRGLAVGDQKKPSLTDLSNELSAAEEAFSTFSLNISDASFQLALAAVEKGERPDPASIKPEQFYNAVDYGDPAPSASEPVAAAIDQTAHPVIPGRNLVRVALRTGSTGRSAAQPLRLTLLVDQSGSMVRADRRAAMETALAQLATLLTEHDQVTVIGFSRTPHLLAQSLPGNQAGKLPELINQTASEGGTNLEEAINLATEQALSHHLAGAQNRIVLFTDGAANLGDANPDRLSEKIKNIRQQGLAFDIAGIGTNDVNDKLLSDLARHGNGRYYLVGEKTAGNLAAQLAGAFRPAAENVKVQVKLNPQRVGNYKLIGFDKDRLKTEDFRNDAVDAAELAADEAGVALYQIETLAEGTGEIGEVSVRFRDTASGEMVERTWTIPYDASAPSFDKANPKTQLATLALLAAQKLQTGPMADAIDFSNYAETIAKLKQANAKSAKTQQLINLINAIK